MRKSGLLAILLGLFGMLLTASSGRAQHYSLAKPSIEDIIFSDPSNGWIVAKDADKYYLLQTTDAGSTWAELTIPSRVNEVFFLDSSTGWALALEGPNDEIANTVLFQTRNGGRSWKRTQEKPFAHCEPRSCTLVVSMAFTDSRHGWLIGQGPEGVGLLWATSNAGRSIHQLKQVCLPDLARGIYADRAGRVWIFGNYFILSSSDKGRTWKEQLKSSRLLNKRPALVLESGLVFENGIGWAAGENATGTILSTSDFGNQWKVAVESDQLTTFMTFSFWDQERGCAVGTSPLLFCTADGGQTWNRKDVLPKPSGMQSPFFAKLILLKSGRGWVLRTGGYLYETLDGGQTWREVDPLRDFLNR
jgi:photosystem II stability/assembly factor-like uncharacterized protein